MTAAPIDLHAPGIDIEAGDHICAFYRGSEQRDEVLLPFLRDGLRDGHRCISVLDTPTPIEVTAPLSLVVDVQAALDSGQLSLLTSEQAYLVDGFFSLERMLDFWEESVGRSVSLDGYPFVRSVGEMTWALRDLPGVEDLVRYEVRLNKFLPRYPQVILCMYDLEQFTDGRILMEMLKSHPKVLLSGQILENPWYVQPGDDTA